MSDTTNSPRTGRPASGRRGLIIGAAAIGIAIGGYSLASAAQGALLDDNPTPAAASVPSTGDTVADDSAVDAAASTVPDDSTTDTATDDSTANSTESEGDDVGDDSSHDVGDDSTASSVEDESGDDNGDDNGTDSDDEGGDDSGQHGSSTTVDAALPAPFTQTYHSAGGSITVSWDGAMFSVDAIDAADGFTAEIKDLSSLRVRVEFKGHGEDSRIEVRISDDDNSVRVTID